MLQFLNTYISWLSKMRPRDKLAWPRSENGINIGRARTYTAFGIVKLWLFPMVFTLCSWGRGRSLEAKRKQNRIIFQELVYMKTGSQNLIVTKHLTTVHSLWLYRNVIWKCFQTLQSIWLCLLLNPSWMNCSFTDMKSIANLLRKW